MPSHPAGIPALTLVLLQSDLALGEEGYNSTQQCAHGSSSQAYRWSCREEELPFGVPETVAVANYRPHPPARPQHLHPGLSIAQGANPASYTHKRQTRLLQPAERKTRPTQQNAYNNCSLARKVHIVHKGDIHGISGSSDQGDCATKYHRTIIYKVTTFKTRRRS